jgi:nicotinamidase-related amidase
MTGHNLCAMSHAGVLPDRRIKMNPPALIIIDMQVGMTWPSAGVRNNPEAEENIKKLLDHWRKESASVVHVHHRSRTVGSPFYPGQPGIEVQPQFKPDKSEYEIEKNVPDAFAHNPTINNAVRPELVEGLYSEKRMLRPFDKLRVSGAQHERKSELVDWRATSSGLAEWLRTRQIDSVVIVGVSTNNSVESTARSAGNLGFKTYVVSDACFAFAKTDYDGVQRTAQEVHAMSLANLDGEYAAIVSCADAIGSIFSGA